MWAGTIGTRRLLKLFEKYNMKTTWFIPGHSLETFPEECAMVRDAGHEMFVSSLSLRHPPSPHEASLTTQVDCMDTRTRIRWT